MNFLLLFAQTATIPTVADLTPAVQAMASVCAVAASLGLSIFIYRIAKNKMSEVLDADGGDNESDDPDDWDEEHRAMIDDQLDRDDAENFGSVGDWDNPESENYAPIAPQDGWGEENDEKSDEAEEESEDESEESHSLSAETASEDDEERRQKFIDAYCTDMSDEEKDNGGLEAAEEAADRLL